MPRAGHSFEHVVLELADSPLAGPLVHPTSRQFTPLLQPVRTSVCMCDYLYMSQAESLFVLERVENFVTSPQC